MAKKLNLISCLHQAKQKVTQARTRKERIRWLAIQCTLEGMIATRATVKNEAKQEQGV
jgi:hypothetical protein